MLAIRMRDVGKYFGPPIEMEGADRPREAWRELLKIAGIDAKSLRDFNTHRTRAVTGHVLRDLSLDIEAGSVVCLTGPSGSGKSVLLQLLAGVLAPTTGRIELYGTVGSILSVGSNLDGNLTAGENLLRACAGASPADAERWKTEAIEFAGLEEFEDVALRTFSSGMTLRLSIAVALVGRPAIVLVDDVLAVGDIAFQQRFLDRLHALKAEGCTMVLALGDDAQAQQLATRIITLNNGHVVSDGPPRHAADEAAAPSAAVEWQVAGDLPEDEVIAMRSLDVSAAGADGGDVQLTLGFEPKVDGVRCRPSIFLNRGRTVLFRSIAPQFVDVVAGRRLMWSVRLPVHILTDGSYSVVANMQSLRDDMVYAMKAQDAVTLTVRRDAAPGPTEGSTPLLSVEMPWEIEPVALVGS
jgi:lipopolysaccharide transport system ATP-binding protein